MVHGKRSATLYSFVIVTVCAGFLLVSFWQNTTAQASSCPVTINIMPLGDSITEGKGSSPTYSDESLEIGYRQPLYLTLTDAGFNFDFVGSRSNGEEATPEFDTDHEGHPGWSASQIESRVDDFLQDSDDDDLPVHVVLLHIGTNSLNADNWQTVEDILEKIDEYSEDTVVVLGRIVNRIPFNPTVTNFNENVQTMADERIADGDRIVVVDHEDALTYDDFTYFFDQDKDIDLHPNVAGYELMADVWYNALQSVLPQVCSDLTGNPIPTDTPTATATHTPLPPTLTPTSTSSVPTDTPPNPTATPTNAPPSVTTTPTSISAPDTASLSGSVWLDSNKNGIRDAEETSIASIPVTLYNEQNQVVESVSTGPEGNYMFTDIAPGTYYVKIDISRSYRFSLQDVGTDDTIDSDVNPESGTTPMITLNAGDNVTSWNAGLLQNYVLFYPVIWP